MKAFYEWWKTNKFGKNNTPGPKDVWRAALKLSLRLLQDQYEGGLSAFDEISKELVDD